jgi:hypothetical protein
MIDFYVYMHRRATTGEIFYVGKGHGNRAWETDVGRSRHWKGVVARCGFTVEIVTSGLQEWYALELEVGLIALHGRRDMGQGPLVNFTDGGEGSTGRVCKQETRDRIGAKAAARPGPSEETRSRMRKAQIGRTHADTTKQKMSASGRKRSSSTFGHRPKVAVVQSESVVFEGTSVAEQWCQENTNPLADKSNIVKCCRGKINYAYGHTWRYATPEETAALKEKAASWAALSDLTV